MDHDGELLLRWGDGDDAAGQELYDRHFPRVYRFFRTKVADGVEDLVQATFLACLEARGRYRGEGKFSTFIYGVARNQLLAHFRKRKSRGRMAAPLEHSVADLGPSPSTVLGKNADEQRLYESICRLPVDLQISLELFYWEDVPSREIASILDVPESTIRSRLRRARIQLRKALDLPDEALPPESSTTDAKEFDKSEWIQRIRTSALESK